MVDAMTPEQAYRRLEGGFVSMDELGDPRLDMAVLRRLAALHLPPEHREAIAERLGCADLPEFCWHRAECRPDANDTEVWYPCYCGRNSLAVRLGVIVLRHGKEFAARYWAGWCGASGHGCGKVWWTRREAQPARVGEPAYIGPDGKVYSSIR
jgi:hypothetical protein